MDIGPLFPKLEDNMATIGQNHCSQTSSTTPEDDQEHQQRQQQQAQVHTLCAPQQQPLTQQQQQNALHLNPQSLPSLQVFFKELKI